MSVMTTSVDIRQSIIEGVDLDDATIEAAGWLPADVARLQRLYKSRVDAAATLASATEAIAACRRREDEYDAPMGEQVVPSGLTWSQLAAGLDKLQNPSPCDMAKVAISNERMGHERRRTEALGVLQRTASRAAKQSADDARNRLATARAELRALRGDDPQTTGGNEFSHWGNVALERRRNIDRVGELRGLLTNAAHNPSVLAPYAKVGEQTRSETAARLRNEMQSLRAFLSEQDARAEALEAELSDLEDGLQSCEAAILVPECFDAE